MDWRCEMARIRTIKPDFFTSEDIVSISPLARLLYIATWLEADREGRFVWRPKTLKLRYLPGDQCDIDSLATELINAGLVVPYVIDGQAFAEIPTFAKHQVINNRESASTIPPRVTDASSTREQHVSNATTTPLMGKEGKGKEGNEEADASVASKQATEQKPACPAEEIVRLYHEAMPDNPRVKILNETRRKTIRARWKEAASLTCQPFGYSSREEGLAAWRRFFQVCADSNFLTGKAPPQPGKPPFIAGIDFLMSPDGFAKCIENHYHREAS